MLPEIPAKRYFTIGEVAELCDVKPHVLRYWEQEFTQLRQIKRRGNRRYYQHHEVLMIRRIRDLLYREGFTINGARSRLQESAQQRDAGSDSSDAQEAQKRGRSAVAPAAAPGPDSADAARSAKPAASLDPLALREALLQIRELLKPQHGATAAAVAPHTVEQRGGDPEPGHDETPGL